MKRTLIVAAISALAAGSALAQSNVTIYGRANVSIEAQDADGVKSTRLVNNASRIGFKGTEDLGGGLKAGFVLEHGFNIDTGAATGGSAGFWGRQAEVNVGGGWGMLRAGRFISEAYFATADYISMHNHDTGTSSDALYAYIGNNSNKVAYRLPTLAKGMSLEGSVAASEGTQAKTYDLAWNYDMGALQLGAGYEKREQFGATSSADQFAVRALYATGPFALGAYVQRDKNGLVSNGGSRTTYRLAGMYSVGASEFHLNWGHAGKYGNVANSDADQWTLGYNYNLSKRTKVYAFYTEVNDSAAKVYGGDFNSLAVGLRHKF